MISFSDVIFLATLEPGLFASWLFGAWHWLLDESDALGGFSAELLGSEAMNERHWLDS